MSKSIEQLLIVLNKEYEAYDQVLDIAKRKRRIIIEGRVKELDELTKEEQTLIMSLGKLEHLRESIVNNIIEDLKIDKNQNLTEITNYLSEDNKEKVTSIKEKLKNLLKDIKAENDINSNLIKQSLDYIEFNRNLISSFENQGSTYGSRADEKAVKRKTNLFDAKV